MAEEQSTLKTLELLYDEVVRESGRLRDARGAFSRQLGPVPLAGGLVLGIFSAFGHHPQHRALAWVAAGLFGLSVVISMATSGLAPYRRLRARLTDTDDNKCSRWQRTDISDDELERWEAPELQGAARRGDLNASPRLPDGDWLRERIKLERALYGTPSVGPPRRELVRPSRCRTLQEAFEIERYAVLLVQALFIAEIIALLFASGAL